MQFGKISSDDLALLLAYFPQLLGSEFPEARQLLLEKESTIFSPDAKPCSWFHLYELPPKEHFIKALLDVGGVGVLQELAQSPNQIQAMPGAVDRALTQIEGWEPDEEVSEALRKSLAAIFGASVSVLNSMRSLMAYGLYLNDVIAKIRNGGKDADRWLLRAVRIDPTVIGCACVGERISRAVMLDDRKFLGQVRSAMAGNLTKRDQKNFLKMRLVLDVLYESGAPRLSTEDLYRLFREELNLVRDEAGDGDVRNNLRQFAYQFMKDRAVSQNA
jgi:hypothetical protein